jgi:hypothetical protein
MTARPSRRRPFARGLPLRSRAAARRDGVGAGRGRDDRRRVAGEMPYLPRDPAMMAAAQSGQATRVAEAGAPGAAGLGAAARRSRSPTKSIRRNARLDRRPARRPRDRRRLAPARCGHRAGVGLDMRKLLGCTYRPELVVRGRESWQGQPPAQSSFASGGDARPPRRTASIPRGPPPTRRTHDHGSQTSRAHRSDRRTAARRRLRDHRRPRQGDDLSIAVSAGAPRPARVSDRGRGGRRLDGRRSARARAHVDRGLWRGGRRQGVRALRCPALLSAGRLRRGGHFRAAWQPSTERPRRSSTSRSRPSSSGMLSRAWPTPASRAARVVVEKPFGHDLESARARRGDASVHRRVPAVPDRPLPRQMGAAEILYLRFANAGLEPIWTRNHPASVQITITESFGLEDRWHFYDPVGAPRDVVVNHLMQVVGAATMEVPASHDAAALKDALHTLFGAIPPADPAQYVRGQYDGYRDIDGVAADSTTETYAAFGDRQLALVRRADLHPHRLAPTDPANRAASGLRARPARCVPRHPLTAAGADAARDRAGPGHGRAAARRGAARPRGRVRADQPRHGVRRGGRRGPHPIPPSGAVSMTWADRREFVDLEDAPDLCEEAVGKAELPLVLGARARSSGAPRRATAATRSRRSIAPS